MKLDLSKNQLTCLPDDLGNLVNLQHLDLYNNKLMVLPVSFSQLRVGRIIFYLYSCAKKPQILLICAMLAVLLTYCFVFSSSFV